jgi:hypothetical protein
VNWQRILYAVLIALNVGLAFFLAGAAEAGVSQMVRLVLGAIVAGLSAVLGLPFVLALSSLDPGKSEKSVAREAALTGRVPGEPPTG